ncbi:MAG: NADH-quinone oxidoreductase subunit J [Cyclobacteriaceae bacterium]
MIQVIQFFFLILALIGIAMIVKTSNVVHAAYSLALVLVSLAGIYVLLNAELLAIVQILLYAGGVVILLMFGVMMTNKGKTTKLISRSKNSFLALILSSTIFAGLVYLFTDISEVASDLDPSKSQIQEIGISFLTEHIVAFELIAFVLLVALVGASYLAKMSSNE